MKNIESVCDLCGVTETHTAHVSDLGNPPSGIKPRKYPVGQNLLHKDLCGNCHEAVRKRQARDFTALCQLFQKGEIMTEKLIAIRQHHEFVVSADGLGKVIAESATTVQVGILRSWEEVASRFNWPMQCRLIVDEMTPVDAARVRMMLDHLVEHLKDRELTT